MIVVEKLEKTYPDLQRGAIWAVRGISFVASPGQVFGLLGPNGAGKTTVLRMLSTMLKPTGGTATVAGYDVETQAEDVRRHIGFVSANTANYDRMSAFEMVEFFGQLHGLSTDELAERSEVVFEQLQMNDFRDVTCGKMSTGMKQKVSIARAIIHDPPVLIFDEATVGLDVLVGRSLQNTVLQFKDQGKCIIYSTHHMNEAERVCDHVAIMYHGDILAEGSQGELCEKHGQRSLEELFFALIDRNDNHENRTGIVADDTIGMEQQP
ncbi:MAG: ATP-binding cassette domain-containing protein [Planctomycetes bacterium]|nr:ATP-binding cassette domain-containing protein [Planctomycetota bacterium]